MTGPKVIGCDGCDHGWPIHSHHPMTAPDATTPASQPDHGSFSQEAKIPTAQADGQVVAASPLEIAYGCLWRVVTDEKALHEARAHVRRHISHNGQQRGVAWAVANLPAVSDAEIRSIEI